MKELIIRWTKCEYIKTGEFDEDGDEITKSEYIIHHERFALDTILKVKTHWGSVEITFIDGTVYKSDDDDCEIYFR